MKISPRVCVFCGSKTGNGNSFIEAAESLGKMLAQEKFELVYGGAGVGLMGKLADSVLMNSGQVVGIMPFFMEKLEVAHKNLTEFFWVGGMHERKRKMYDMSDAFVAIPGGFGTLDELFEILTWGQLEHHNLPIFILNIYNYYDHLIKHVEIMVQAGFVSQKHKELFKVVNSIEELKIELLKVKI